MEDPKRWTIQINRKLIVMDLFVENIKDHMIQSGIMDCADFETIQNSGKNHKERSSAFLDILVTRGSAAFDSFCQALNDHLQSHISEKLRHDVDMLTQQLKGNKIAIDASTLQKILRQTDDLSEMKLKAKVMEEEMIALERKNAKLSTKLNKVRRKSNELFEENNTVRGKHEQSQKILNTVTQLFEDSKKHIKELKNEKNDLDKCVTQFEEKMNVQDLRMAMLEQERKELEDHALEQEMEWSYQEGVNTKLKEDLLKKQEELKQMCEELKNKALKLQEYEENLKQLRDNKQKVDDTIQEKLVVLRKTVQEHELENNELKETNKELEKCVSNQDNKISYLTKHLNDIKHGLAEMNYTIAFATKQNEMLEEKSKIQEGTIQKLEMERKEFTKVNTNQELIIKHLNLRVQSLLSDRDSAAKEVISANQNLQQILLQHINLTENVIKRQNSPARSPVRLSRPLSGCSLPLSGCLE